MLEKKLSIIVPVYNVEQYLKKCVESIINQSYRNLEIILVDDGSTDGCPRICDDFVNLDLRIKTIHKQNGGQGSARNRGLDVATGEYIAFVDSDDWVEENMYEVMIESLERTDSDMAFCGFFSHSGIRVAESCPIKNEQIWDSPEKILQAFFDGEAIGVPWNKVYKRELFDDVRYPEGVAREDIYIMHTLYGKCRRAVYTGKSFYNYLVREGSSEHQKFQSKYLVSLKIADDRYIYISANFPTLLDSASISCYGARLDAIREIVRSDSEKAFKSEYESLKEYIRVNSPTSKFHKRLRREILFFPAIYKFKVNCGCKYRRFLKQVVLKMLGK